MPTGFGATLRNKDVLMSLAATAGAATARIEAANRRTIVAETVSKSPRLT